MRAPIDDCATRRARKRMNQQRPWRDARSIEPGRRAWFLLAALAWLAAPFLVGAGGPSLVAAGERAGRQPVGRAAKLLAAASIREPASGARSLRSLQLGGPSSYAPRAAARPAALALEQPLQASPEAPIPYKTFFVTQACEWKSNLFVPKSNDLHFAQPADGAGAGAAKSTAPQSTWPLEARQQAAGEQESRTIFSSSQKALILALPIELDADFAGFEPACSIRLIVPRNMRILARLAARKLSFAPQVAGPSAAALERLPFEPAAPDERQLWLNVSSDQFGELEQRELESESNVLAFRFLLERFAHRREPETRFQVVVSAFQTLGENSDFNQANAAQSGQQEQQFICDAQRLISASLLCDGFPNCQDGRDENPADCAAFRQAAEPATASQRPSTSGAAHNQTSASQPPAGKAATSWLGRLADLSSPAGLLVGLLLVLLLLASCTCWLYCLYLLLRGALSGHEPASGRPEGSAGRRLRAARPRHLWAGQTSGARRPTGSLFARLPFRGLGKRLKRADERPAGSAEETDSLARSQNAENAARLKARALLERAAGSGLAAPRAPPARPPHSILKRPSPLVGAAGAPLARFESIPFSASASGSGGPAAPRAPPRASERAVDVGPAAGSAGEQPARPRGALAHSLTHARDSGRRAHDFRPTPAARAHPRAPAPTSSRSQGLAPATASISGAPTSAPETSEQLRYRSSSSQVEQTSTQTDGRRLTVYQYSSSVAQFSESYLVREHSAPAPPAEPADGERLPSSRAGQQVQQARQP